MAVRDIAEGLGVTIGTVKTLLFPLGGTGERLRRSVHDSDNRG